MASNLITLRPGTTTAFTITLASLANNAARQTTLVTNSSDNPAALVGVKITSGTVAPTAGQVYEVYLLRSNGTIADDQAGAADAAITIETANLLGTIPVTADASKAFELIFDTGPLGPLGPTWGIAIRNASGQAIHSTEANHRVDYTYITPDVEAAA